MRYMHDVSTPLKIRKARKQVANFDSAAAMLRSTGRALRGKDFPAIGIMPAFVMPVMERLVGIINALPDRLKEWYYSVQGAREGLTAKQLSQVRAEDISHWAVSQYPKRKYPAVAIGSSNGALVHLCAALQIPWLPQTVFIPVKHHKELDVDVPKKAIEWGRAHAAILLENNPELQLHHMYDPAQDRLMLSRMTYFRVKRLVLGEVYKQFLQSTLEPGGVILISECTLKMPVTKVSDRHIFQFGAEGGATIEDYHQGSRAVQEYLERYNVPIRQWDPPKPTHECPEAEWGFEPKLLKDIEEFAAQNGYRLKRLRYENPEDMSPLVADLYRWWYRQRNYHPNRLLVESFIVHEPHWALRTGSVPFWMTFNMEPSAKSLEEYLQATEPYDFINLMLFSHGVESVGLASADRWLEILEMAQKKGAFTGVDAKNYPRDFAAFARYYTAAKRIPSRYALPGSLPLEWFENFWIDNRSRYKVELI